MEEITDGLWHWTGRHPKIHMEVSSYFVPEHGLLLDPLVPPEGLARLEELGPPRVGMHEFTDGQPVEPYDFGDPLVGGAVTVHEVGAICADESALHIPSVSALAVADGVIHYGGLRFVPDDLMDDPEDTRVALKEAYARLAADLDFENLLTAHGVPIVGGAREELRDFATAPSP